MMDEEPPELVLVDLMLPGMSGLDVVRSIRLRSDVPIVIVTARLRQPRRRRGPRSRSRRLRAEAVRSQRAVGPDPGIVAPHRCRSSANTKHGAHDIRRARAPPARGDRHRETARRSRSPRPSSICCVSSLEHEGVVLSREQLLETRLGLRLLRRCPSRRRARPPVAREDRGGSGRARPDRDGPRPRLQAPAMTAPERRAPVRFRRVSGLRLRVTAGFALGSFLLVGMLSLVTYFFAAHYLVRQRERTLVHQAEGDAGVFRADLRRGTRPARRRWTSSSEVPNTDSPSSMGGTWYRHSTAKNDPEAARRGARVASPTGRQANSCSDTVAHRRSSSGFRSGRSTPSSTRPSPSSSCTARFA